MRLLTLLLLASLQAYADTPVSLDATTVIDPSTTLDEGVEMILEKGQPAPFRGLLTPEARAIHLTQQMVGCLAEVATLKAAPPMPLPWAAIVATAVTALLVGGVVGGVLVGVARGP